MRTLLECETVRRMEDIGEEANVSFSAFVSIRKAVTPHLTADQSGFKVRFFNLSLFQVLSKAKNLLNAHTVND